MTYEELNKCELPVEVIELDGKERFESKIVAFNKAGFLYECKGEEYCADISLLQYFSLKPETVEITLYKYNYFDSKKQERVSTKWTTESFENYFGINYAYSIFELTSTEKKVVTL